MPDIQTKQHSKLGLLSCMTAVAVWVYFAAAFYLIFYVDGVTAELSRVFIPESRGMSDLRGMGVAVVIFAVIFFVVPSVGHLLGMAMAVIGLFRASKKRLLPVLGLILNLLPFFILLVLFLVGSLVPTN